MIYVENPNYSPNRLVNKVMEVMGYEHDCQLAEAIGRHRSQVTRLRGKKENLSAGWLIDLHDLTGLSVNELREFAGVAPVVAEKVREAA